MRNHDNTLHGLKVVPCSTPSFPSRRDSSRHSRIICTACRFFLASGFLCFGHGIFAAEIHFPPDRPLDVKHIKLELTVDLTKKRMDATATVTMTALKTVSSVSLDAVDFQVHKVTGTIGKDSNEQPLIYANDGRHLEIFLPHPVLARQQVEVRIDYTIEDPEAGLNFFAPSEDDPNAPYQLWSQGESIQNRYWIPCFDNPNEFQTTEIIATVDDHYQVLSNGHLVSKKKADTPGKMIYHWIQDQPHAAYLVTLVVGDFAIERQTWRSKDVLYYVPPDKKDQIKTSFANTTRMLDFFSDRLGVEYPWDKYAQVCCYQFGGGMENTSATTLGYRALVSARAKMDTSSDGLISHELAHQWFGDFVTCRDWAHLWLNEGFASYFQALWTEEDLGPDEFAYDMYKKALAATGGDKEYPIVHRAYRTPGQQFDSRAYPKGAWVLHMLRSRVGDDVFFSALNAYLKTHAHTPVETADLRHAFEQTTGQNFERFFYDWTQRPGHPILHVGLKWKEDEKLAEVSVQQKQDNDEFEFPLAFEFTTDKDQPPVRVRRMLREKGATFLIPLPTRPILFRVDPDQTVLMELTLDMGRDLWVAELTDDPNPVGRIRAAQHLAKSGPDDKGAPSDVDLRLLGDALKKESFWGVQDEIAQVLGKAGGDIARDALIEGLNSQNPKVRRACVRALSQFDDDDSVRLAVADILAHGDESDRVLAAAVTTYGKLKADDIMERVKPLLTHDSRLDEIKAAVIGAFGQLSQTDAIDAVLPFADVSQRATLRRAAVGALGDLAERQTLDKASSERIADAMVIGLKSKSRYLRTRCANALGALGKQARSALPTLRRITSNSFDNRLSDAVDKAIKAIEEDQPSNERLTEMQKQIDALSEENNTLKKRVKTLEARGSTYQQKLETTKRDDHEKTTKRGRSWFRSPHPPAGRR